jgi:dihydrofolate synthase / folylpolyglutamate synthase
MSSSLDRLLEPFKHFGVNLGLSRIENLLADLGNPHLQVPIIHVAGTNGKGSVCAYLTAILKESGYRVGRFISPHLIDWTERISINHTSISETEFAELIIEIQQYISLNKETPTQFEVITAAAWLYFARHHVDLAIIEVGLGGRLDATNVCSQPLVSIITSISKEHWQVLGDTLGKIATEKAGILKANCPAVIGKLPAEAEAAVKAKIAELNCPTVWSEAARRKGDNQVVCGDLEYDLPLLGDVQLINSSVAIAAIRVLQKQGWNVTDAQIQQGIAKTQWAGRIQWLKYQNQSILIDGAHNPDSARVLRQYTDTQNKPIAWVMGMLSTKDHSDIFQQLLKAGDRLYLTPVPDRSSADPRALSQLAADIYPQLQHLQVFPDVFTALSQAIEDNPAEEYLVVLCGSLYLLGYFLKKSIPLDAEE